MIETSEKQTRTPENANRSTSNSVEVAVSKLYRKRSPQQDITVPRKMVLVLSGRWSYVRLFCAISHKELQN